jgi:xylose isomerase
MKLKHAVMVAMLGRIFDRFHEYQPARDLPECLDMARQVQGKDGIEIVYPNHFRDVAETVKLVKDSGLEVAALNLDVKAHKRWQAGAFAACDPQLRREAVAHLKTALDLAAELGTNLVTCCPLIDGHNYNFEVDHLHQWQWLEEGICEGARHRSDIRLSLEYKQSEARNYNLLANVGRALYLCERIGLPHVGITFDVGHAILAKESPAEALCLAAQANRLFYIHFNDNTREWDWDMLPGAVHFWDLMETVFYLKRLGWEGWLSYDIVTRNGDLVESMSTSIELVETAVKLVDKFGCDRLQALIEDGVPARTYSQLVRALL